MCIYIPIYIYKCVYICMYMCIYVCTYPFIYTIYIRYYIQISSLPWLFSQAPRSAWGKLHSKKGFKSWFPKSWCSHNPFKKHSSKWKNPFEKWTHSQFFKMEHLPPDRDGYFLIFFAKLRTVANPKQLQDTLLEEQESALNRPSRWPVVQRTAANRSLGFFCWKAT